MHCRIEENFLWPFVYSVCGAIKFVKCSTKMAVQGFSSGWFDARQRKFVLFIAWLNSSLITATFIPVITPLLDYENITGRLFWIFRMYKPPFYVRSKVSNCFFFHVHTLFHVYVRCGLLLCLFIQTLFNFPSRLHPYFLQRRMVARRKGK